MEQALDHHMRECDQVDETAFCVACGEIVHLHDRDTYETCQDGVICLICVGRRQLAGCFDRHVERVASGADGQALADWFNERVANGVDPIEAARDADACCCESFEQWQKHFQSA